MDEKKDYIMYSNQEVDNTLDEAFMTSFLANAQKDEWRELKKLFDEVYEAKGAPLRILDIGVGDARVPLLIQKDYDFDKVEFYVGFDNAQMEVDKASKIIEEAGLGDKVAILQFNALELSQPNDNIIFKDKYDLVICTYFTPGNFKPDEIKLETGEDGMIVPYPQSCLEPNQKFIQVFGAAEKLLNPGGKLVLGTTYIDNEETRQRQIDFYEKCGMTVITSEKDEFNATKEGFWSERFTEEKFYKYFPSTDKENIKFIPLDDSNFARMVVVSK